MSFLDEVRAHRAALSTISRELAASKVHVEAPWPGDVSAVNLMLRAPMEHIGASDLDVFVEMFDGDEKIRGLPAGARPAHTRAAVWFDQVVEGLCVFAADEQQVQNRALALHGVAVAVTEVCAHRNGIVLTPEDDARALAVAAGLGRLLMPSATCSGAVLDEARHAVFGPLS